MSVATLSDSATDVKRLEVRSQLANFNAATLRHDSDSEPTIVRRYLCVGHGFSCDFAFFDCRDEWWYNSRQS